MDAENRLETVCKNLKKLRESKHLSISQLSKVSQIDAEALEAIEHGEDFDVWYLIRLCGIYNVNLREIFTPYE